MGKIKWTLSTVQNSIGRATIKIISFSMDFVTKIENEQHFTIKCHIYNELMQPLFTSLTEIDNEFDVLDDNRKFCFLLTSWVSTHLKWAMRNFFFIIFFSYNFQNITACDISHIFSIITFSASEQYEQYKSW